MKSNDPNYYRKASQGGQELQAGSISVGKKWVMVAFEDETWTGLYH
jgi:hypothetical protein